MDGTRLAGIAMAARGPWDWRALLQVEGIRCGATARRTVR